MARHSPFWPKNGEISSFPDWLFLPTLEAPRVTVMLNRDCDESPLRSDRDSVFGDTVVTQKKKNQEVYSRPLSNLLILFDLMVRPERFELPAY